MLNSFALNTTALNVVEAAPAAPVGYEDTHGRPYRLEIHNPAGDLLYMLTLTFGGVWERPLNAPARLRFGHPWLDDGGGGDTIPQFPNEVWLYEGNAREASGKFRILRRTLEEGDGAWWEFECADYSEQLARETCVGYATPTDADGNDLGANVSTVVAFLLEQQTQTPKVAMGSIAAAIGSKRWYGRFDGRSLMQCMQDLQEFAGGYWYVDGYRRLQWRTSVGYDEGHRLRLGHNATGVRTTWDYSELATRVIARGAGTTADTVLSVTKNDTAAQAVFGVIVARITDQSIHDMHVLEAVAIAELKRRRGPVLKYELDAIDLSKTDVYDYSFEARALTPGTRINLLTQALESVMVRVERVVVDLDRLLGVTIEVTADEAQVGQGGASPGSIKDREDVAAIIAELAGEIDDLKNDRGEVDSVRASLDPVPVDLGAVATWDTSRDAGNLPDKLADLLDLPYGVPVDGAKDGIVETVVQAITEDRNGIRDAISEVGGSFSLVEASDRSALNTAMTEGQLGRTTGTYKHVFEKEDREYPLQVLRAPDLSSLDALAKEFEDGCTTNDGARYWYGKDRVRVRLDALD